MVPAGNDDESNQKQRAHIDFIVTQSCRQVKQKYKFVGNKAENQMP